MNQGTQGYSLMKKTEGRKSRDTVSLKREPVVMQRAILKITKRLAYLSMDLIYYRVFKGMISKTFWWECPFHCGQEYKLW
jgi:hypothetical protein